jgi:hypothetical protein
MIPPIEIRGSEIIKAHSQVEVRAGQEGWFIPADFRRQASGGKPPFLTCEFAQLPLTSLAFGLAFELVIAKATEIVVIDQTDGLHESVADR